MNRRTLPPKRFRVALLCSDTDKRRIEGDLDSVSTVREVRPLRDATMKSALRMDRTISVVSSDIPGLGKTESIKARAHRDGLELCSVVISGATSRDEIVHSLHNALHAEGAADRINALHINILDVPLACAEEVNDILFELLYLSMVSGRTSSAVSLVHVGQPAIFIELANMVQGDEFQDATLANRDLKYRLPVCRYLQDPVDHLTWDLAKPDRRPVVCADLTSNMQVVLNFLRVLQAATINDQILTFDGHGALPNDEDRTKFNREATVVGADEAIQLLNTFFFDEIEGKGQQPSFSLLNSFLAFLAAQLRKFTVCSSSFYRPDFMRDKNVRTTIVSCLVEAAVRFAARSRSGEGTLAERVAPQSFDSINYLLLLIQPEGGLTPFYRQVDVFEQLGGGALAQWYRQANGGKIPDYAMMEEEGLKDALSKFLGPQSENFIKSDQLEYALTGDNILKMMLVHVRVTAGLPVVIMGETGCGKTSLLKYLARAASIEDDNFRVLNIHAGIGKAQIIEFVRSAEQYARQTGEQVHGCKMCPSPEHTLNDDIHCIPGVDLFRRGKYLRGAWDDLGNRVLPHARWYSSGPSVSLYLRGQSISRAYARDSSSRPRIQARSAGPDAQARLSCASAA